MRNHQRVVLILAMMVLSIAGVAQSQKGDPASRKAAVAPNGVAQPVAQPVVGGGTAGQLTKWTGSNSTTSSIGDSTITEDKFLNVGIGTATPTSKLTVAGTIETTSGGVKFPDGSTQTTAGISSVAHDATLAGNGTGALPLGIAPGGVGTIQIADGAVTGPKIAAGAVGNQQLANAAVTSPKIAPASVGTTHVVDASITGAKLATGAVGSQQLADAAVTSPKIAPASVGTTHVVDASITGAKLAPGAVGAQQLADAAITAPKIAPSQVVKGLNGLTDNIQLVAGSNVTLTPSGNTITIAASGQERQPYQATAVIEPLDDNVVSVDFQVPEGQRLVIEYVSAKATTVNAEPVGTFQLSTRIAGQSRMNHFIPADHSFFNLDIVGLRQFVVGQVTRLYSDDSVGFRFFTLMSTRTGLEVTISGYLVTL